MLKRGSLEEGLNPYIALAALGLSLVFVLIFFVAAVLSVGQAGWEQVRYRDAQKVVLEAIEAAPLSVRPQVLNPGLRNDPPGAQRWAFAGRRAPLFEPGTAVLTAQGRTVLARFARALRRTQNWRRLRIEGHTLPPVLGRAENWDLSAARASAVAAVFVKDGGIPAYYLAVAARGGQTPFNGPGGDPNNPSNERVEIVVEYAQTVQGQ